MNIERESIASMGIEDFAEQHGLTMLISERPRNDAAKFYARFKGADVKEQHVLIGVHGNGATEADAIQDYANQISLKCLVLRADYPDRRVIEVPILTCRANVTEHYPETTMTANDFNRALQGQQSCVESGAAVAIANAALRHAIDTGLVAPKEAYDQVNTALREAERRLEIIDVAAQCQREMADVAAEHERAILAVQRTFYESMKP